MAQTQAQPRRTALVLIDIQNGFLDSDFWGPSRSNPSFEHNASLLLTKYRSLVASTSSASSPAQHKTIHVIHSSLNASSPLHPSNPGYQIQAFATPLPASEPVLVKHVNSGFIGTDLEAVLREHFAGAPGTLYVIGLTADHCVSTTVRMAANLGVCDSDKGEKGEVVLVGDATASWKKGEGDAFSDAELVHKVHLESLNGEFATVVKTARVLEEWSAMIGA